MLHRIALAVVSEWCQVVSVLWASGKQVQAWAPSVPDPEECYTRMNARLTLPVAEEGDGHLDMLYECSTS